MDRAHIVNAKTSRHEPRREPLSPATLANAYLGDSTESLLEQLKSRTAAHWRAALDIRQITEALGARGVEALSTQEDETRHSNIEWGLELLSAIGEYAPVTMRHDRDDDGVLWFRSGDIIAALNIADGTEVLTKLSDAHKEPRADFVRVRGDDYGRWVPGFMISQRGVYAIAQGQPLNPRCKELVRRMRIVAGRSKAVSAA